MAPLRRCCSGVRRGGWADEPAAARRRRQALFRRVVVGVVGLFFVLPLVAMLEFTTRGAGGGRSPRHLGDAPGRRRSRARLPRAVDRPDRLGRPGRAHRRHHAAAARPDDDVGAAAAAAACAGLVEFICLLPLTIPAIVLVVGLAPVYAWVTYFLGRVLRLRCASRTSMLVLPYAYRAIDAGLGAIDVRTLAEAARSPRRGWVTVMCAGRPAQHPLGGAAPRRSCRGAGARRVHHRHACSTATTSRSPSTCSARATPRSRSRCRSPRCCSRSLLLFAAVVRSAPAGAPSLQGELRSPPSPTSATPPRPRASRSG